MARSILTAVRHLDQLHGSLLLSALELAHRADGFSGELYISYTYLAAKCHYSRRTALRHIRRLIDAGILACQRFFQADHKWGVNKYKFLIQWDRPPLRPRVDAQTAFGTLGAAPAHLGHGDSLAPILPTPERERGKYGRWEEATTSAATVLSWLEDPDGALARLIRGGEDRETGQAEPL